MHFIAGLLTPGACTSKWRRWEAIRATADAVAVSAKSVSGSLFEVALTANKTAHVEPGETTAAGASVLAGILFSAQTHDKQRIGQDELQQLSEQVVASRGAYLSDRFWGHYSGLFFDVVDGSLTAVRDPMGGRTLFYYIGAAPELILFSDSLAVLLQTIHSQLQVDRKAIVLGLHYINGLPTRRTAFADVLSLLPGECLRLDGGTGASASHLPWWQNVASGGVAGNVSEELRRVVRSWASEYERIALWLSGGLDSAGLLGALAAINRSPDVHCVTHYSAGGKADERPFARTAAKHVGVELSELDTDGFKYALQLPATYKYSPRPHQRLIFSQIDESLSEEAKKRRCAVNWVGLGGDTLFLACPPAILVSDAYQQGGLSAAFKTLVEMGILEEKPIWRLAKEAWKYRAEARSMQKWAVRMRSVWSGSESDLHDADASAFNLIDACFSQVRNPAQRGRCYDVYAEVWGSTTWRPFLVARGVDYLSPYHSAPFVAAALSIPAHHTVQYGLNRFPQREMVQEFMPPEISQRAEKGTTDDPILRSLLANADRIEQLLSHGILVDLGIISVDDTRVSRTNVKIKDGPKNFNIMNLLATEVWLRGHRDLLGL